MCAMDEQYFPQFTAIQSRFKLVVPWVETAHKTQLQHTFAVGHFSINNRFGFIRGWGQRLFAKHRFTCLDGGQNLFFMDRTNRANKDRIHVVRLNHFDRIVIGLSAIFAGNSVGNITIDIADGADPGVLNHRLKTLEMIAPNHT